MLRVVDISAALGLQAVQANYGGYRDWPQPTQWEMIRILARDTTAGPVLFRRQLPPQMLLIDHLLQTSLFPFQHYVQRRGAILEALYQISEGFWFSPFELVMTADRPKTRCVKCVPKCTSARVAPSNIVYLSYGYRSTGKGVLTIKVLLFR